MHIAIDRNRCQGLGLCALNAPELFTLNDDGTVDYTRRLARARARSGTQLSDRGHHDRAVVLKRG